MDKETLLKRIYNLQVRNSKKRGHNPPTYSFGSFRDWSVADKAFTKLYNAWVDSGYEPYLAPSCDRLLDNHGYAFNNIQWVTYKENLSKPRGMQQTRIAMLDRLNTPVAIFFGLNIASKILKISTKKLAELLENGRVYDGYTYKVLEGWK